MTDSRSQQPPKPASQAPKAAGRREPDFDINSLDEAHVGHRERRQRERRQGSAQRSGRGGRSGLVLSLISLIMLVAVALVGFLELSELKQKMSKAQASLDDMNLLSGNQFESLKAALDSADQQQTQWGKGVDKQLKLLDSEMRKLWVIAHQTNQPQIKKLETDLAQLTKSTQDLTNRLKEQVKVINGQAETLAAIKKNEADLKKGVDSLVALKTTLDEHRIRLDDVPVSIEALKLQLSELEGQAKESAVLLNQLDQYRAQVNRSIDQLTEEIRLLKGGGSQPGL